MPCSLPTRRCARPPTSTSRAGAGARSGQVRCTTTRSCCTSRRCTRTRRRLRHRACIPGASSAEAGNDPHGRDAQRRRRGEAPRGTSPRSRRSSTSVSGKGGSGFLAALEETIDGMGEDDAFLRLALQVHRARRFYERPESRRDYRATPRRNATHRRPPSRPRTSTSDARSPRTTRRSNGGSVSSWISSPGTRPPAREPVAVGAHRAGATSRRAWRRRRGAWRGRDPRHGTEDRRLAERAAAPGQPRSLRPPRHGSRRVGAEGRPVPVDGAPAPRRRGQRRPGPRRPTALRSSGSPSSATARRSIHRGGSATRHR